MAEPMLGDLGRDSVTGFAGIIVSETEYLNGCNRLGIQPPMSENKIPDCYYIDKPQVEVVEAGKIQCFYERTTAELHVGLGDLVEDEVTKMQGVITSITRYLSGRVGIYIQPGIDKDGKMVEGSSTSVELVKLISRKKKPVGNRNTGGPMSRSPFK